MENVSELAKRFVELAKRYEEQKEVPPLSEEELALVYEVACAAGFECKGVVLGRVMVYVESRGMFPLNGRCPAKFLNEEGGDHQAATCWLNQLWKLAEVPRLFPSNDDRTAQLVEKVHKEILRSVPLAPIWLTNRGDMLLEYPPSGLGFFVDHTKEGAELGITVGVHQHCNGFMERIRATVKEDVLRCRRCSLRVYLPRDIETYGELREYLKHSRR